jgi:hypothetical protein
MSSPSLPLRFALASLVLVSLLTSGRAAAEVAVGIHAGTLGIGPQVAVPLGDRSAARLVAGLYSHETTYDETGIEYDAEAELRSALLLLDFHPGGGAFRLTVGGGWNGTGLDVSAPVEELLRREVPDLPPLPLDAGTVHGRAEGQTLVPYAGLGFGGSPRGRGRWGVSFDLGAVYHGEPEVELGTSLPFSLPAQVQRELDRIAADEEARLEEELRDYAWLPVVALGITFRL